MSLPRYASSGAIGFLARYVWRRILSHSIVLLAVFGLLINKSLSLLERRLLRWRVGLEQNG